MVENQIELNEKRIKLFDRLCDIDHGLGDMVTGVVSSVYKDGVISKKNKYLIALAIAMATGCRICVLAQLTSAIEEGASRQEIMELISVVYAMKGTSGTAESLRIIEYMDEIGLSE